MSTAANRLPVFAAATCLAALVGCGGAYDAAVSGVVTVDGAPVPKGTVSFAPHAGGPSGFGMIGSDGKYVVRTGREEGLPSGQYNVTVAANESGAPSRDGGPPLVGKSLVPLWYREPSFSGLNFDVAPGEQEINLELKSTPPPQGWKAPR